MPSIILGRDFIRHRTRSDDTFIFNRHGSCEFFKPLASRDAGIFLLNSQMSAASVEIERGKVNQKKRGEREEREKKGGDGRKRGEERRSGEERGRGRRGRRESQEGSRLQFQQGPLPCPCGGNRGGFQLLLP